MKKSASRSKLLHCFRPMVDMDDEIEPKPEPEPEPGFSYLLVEKTDDEDDPKAVSEKKRTISRVVKAVFFETVLAKKARDKSLSRSFSKSRELTSLNSLVPKNRIASSSSCSSLTALASEPANQTYPKINKEDYNIAETIKYERGYHLNMGLYFLMISLAITVLCGRFLAILFTSAWLCVVFSGERARKSRRRAGRGRSS